MVRQKIAHILKLQLISCLALKVFHIKTAYIEVGRGCFLHGEAVKSQLAQEPLRELHVSETTAETLSHQAKTQLYCISHIELS